jgi:hypothetical protein
MMAKRRFWLFRGVWWRHHWDEVMLFVLVGGGLILFILGSWLRNTGRI